MGLRFRKSIKLAPRVRFNVGTKSMGISFGGKGLRYSINSRTGGRTTISLPGTGLSYSASTKSKSKSISNRQYKTQAYQRRTDLIKMQREVTKMEALKQAQLEVQLFENQLEMIKSIHKECDEAINWNEIKETQPPFLPSQTGPKEVSALFELDNFKPNIFQKWFKLDEKKRVQLREKIHQAKSEDKDDWDSWESLVSTATNIISGYVDQYLNVIQEMSPLDDLSDFGSGFEFFIEDPTILEIDFDVQSENVIPKESKSLTQSGKLSIKQMTKTQYFDLYQDYVCSCVLRIARDMFAILPFTTVYIHAMDHQVNTSTGHMDHVTILSVRIERNSLNRLNFETIDCSDSMQNFTHNMKFVKTSGFKPVSKLVISTI